MTAPRESLGLRLVGYAWLAVWRIVRLLPARWAARAFDLLSLRDWRRNVRRRGIVRENLAAVVEPERLDAAVKAAFLSYGRYWMETFRMQDMPSDELTRRFGEDGIWRIAEAHDAGRGAVLATLHLGNWDAGGRWVAERWPLTAVAEVLRPRILFERFAAHRRSLGITIVPLHKGGDATARCLEQLRNGDLVALVADRDLSGTGIPAEMFGRKTKLPPGPAVLSLRAGAPLLPACIYMEPDGRWTGYVMERIDTGIEPSDPGAIAALTQRLAEAFEHMIARAPEQWHAFQRYWV